VKTKQAWVVDTCVLLDVLLDDPKFAQASESCLIERRDQGLTVCTVTIVELAAALPDLGQLYDFLADYGVDARDEWRPQDTEAAHSAWRDALSRRRQTGTPRRPIADVFIGAFAQQRAGLITRNPNDFQTLFPKLRQIVPRGKSGNG
jgi:predicted nucleic acid-binding protein